MLFGSCPSRSLSLSPSLVKDERVSAAATENDSLPFKAATRTKRLLQGCAFKIKVVWTKITIPPAEDLKRVDSSLGPTQFL